jgi:hypothetical protein
VDGTSPDLSMLQCASYSLEMLSHGGLRSHVIGALVTDDTIQLLYYDRSTIIVSEPGKTVTFYCYVASNRQSHTVAARLRRND